jgi:hypothetical protein
MKKIIIICLISFSLVSTIFSQDYKTGMGIRAGFFNGITWKYFLWPDAATEVLLDTRWRGFDVTGLYEMHNQAFNLERLKWYIGGGLHIGVYNGNYISWGRPGSTYEVMGIDGIVGIEYSFKSTPFNMGIDWKPSINFIGYKSIWPDGGALSIRYTL